MKNLPPLPRQPESIESCQARWKDALEFPVDLDAVKDHPDTAYYPSKFRRHVFDTDEFRFIVSRDRTKEEGLEFLHVSVSTWVPKNNIDQLTRAIEVLKEIGGDDVAAPPDQTHQTQKGVLNFFWKL